MTFSPFFFFFFVSLLSFPHSIPHSPFATSQRHSQHPNNPNTEPDHIRNIQASLSSAINLYTNDPIRNDLAIATIPFATTSPSRRSFTDPHSQRSRRIVHRRHQIVRRTCRFCLLIVTFACRCCFYRRHICSLSSLKRTVVAEA